MEWCSDKIKWRNNKIEKNTKYKIRTMKCHESDVYRVEVQNEIGNAGSIN